VRAGMAGLIKVALSLYHGVKPPTLHVREPEPLLAARDESLRLPPRGAPLAGARAAAGLSAFGFGGTNFHAVLSAPRMPTRPTSAVDRWPAELFLFRGRDRAAAAERVAQVERLVGRERPLAPARPGARRLDRRRRPGAGRRRGDRPRRPRGEAPARPGVRGRGRRRGSPGRLRRRAPLVAEGGRVAAAVPRPGEPAPACWPTSS